MIRLEISYVSLSSQIEKLRASLWELFSRIDCNFDRRSNEHNTSGLRVFKLFGRLGRCYHVVFKQQLGQSEFDFKESESHSNACSRTETERQIDSWMAFDLGRESEWVELLNVWSPVFKVKVKSLGVCGDGYAPQNWNTVDCTSCCASTSGNTRFSWLNS